MLDLSRVTLLFVETRAHAVTKRVIDDCLTKVAFGDILIYTDKPDLIPVSGARYEIVPDFPDKREAGRFYYSEAMTKVETDFALMLEWDAGICDPSKWKPEFFNFDYIGAPWPPYRNSPYFVGNGGFALMSKKLGHFICENAREHPVYDDMDVCRRAPRQLYDGAGFKWADPDLASCFAWELGPRNPDNFGFHGAFTWPACLPKDELIVRTGLLTETPYLMAKMFYLVRVYPEILKELPPEQAQRFIATYGDQFSAQPPNHVLGQPRPGFYMSSQQRAAMMLHQSQRRPTQGLKA
jgi:hypothetical protein